MRKLVCLCAFQTTEPALFVEHMIATGHVVNPEMRAELQNPQVRDEFIAVLLAAMTADNPEEIGAVPIGRNDTDVGS